MNPIEKFFILNRMANKYIVKVSDIIKSVKNISQKKYE